MQNYYKSELKKLDTSGRDMKIKITGENGQTNWLNLNTESAPIIADWLLVNFYHQATPPQTKD
jgi:hypothetical protein